MGKNTALKTTPNIIQFPTQAGAKRARRTSSKNKADVYNFPMPNKLGCESHINAFLRKQVVGLDCRVSDFFKRDVMLLRSSFDQTHLGIFKSDLLVIDFNCIPKIGDVVLYRDGDKKYVTEFDPSETLQLCGVVTFVLHPCRGWYED